MDDNCSGYYNLYRGRKLTLFVLRIAICFFVDKNLVVDKRLAFAPVLVSYQWWFLNLFFTNNLDSKHAVRVFWVRV